MIIVEPVKMEKSSIPIEHKQEILSYLKNGKHPVCAPMYYKDRETGKYAIEAYYLDDEKYCWSSDTIYHFERYNYPLPDDFIKYVITK